MVEKRRKATEGRDRRRETGEGRGRGGMEREGGEVMLERRQGQENRGRLA